MKTHAKFVGHVTMMMSIKKHGLVATMKTVAGGSTIGVLVSVGNPVLGKSSFASFAD